MVTTGSSVRHASHTLCTLEKTARARQSASNPGDGEKKNT